MAESRLQHLPVTLFAAVMGVGGLALAWRRASAVWEVPRWPFLVLLALATLAFLVVGVAYAGKWVRHRAAARAELAHPVRMAFVPTVTIAVLVLATAYADVVPALARVLWWVGAVGHLLATVLVISAWFRRADIGAAHVTPAWFIPIVGNVITPLAARSVGNLELAWFAFGVGVVFWIALLPLLLHRVLVHEPQLPPRLLPTVAIFIAPPAVIMLSWQSLTGRVDDAFGRATYATAVFFLVLLLAQARPLVRLPFAPPFLAYTFPLAAAAAAAVAMAGASPSLAADIVAVAVLALATAVVAVVLSLTIRSAVRGELLVPEG
ncbi:MAG: SLAC1 anion channel family protein [Tetrasphaera sp.]|nr:SLAC1 anion channel family protein [Tetrasphaera sp.]